MGRERETAPQLNSPERFLATVLPHGPALSSFLLRIRNFEAGSLVTGKGYESCPWPVRMTSACPELRKTTDFSRKGEEE
jgi:hypothetical protein